MPNNETQHLVRDVAASGIQVNSIPQLPAAVGRQTLDPYVSMMRYKRWSDAQLLTALLARPNIEAEPSFALIREILGHFHVVDCIFKAHLEGAPHGFTTTRLDGAPTLLQLRDRVSVVDQWYVDYVERTDHAALGEALSVRFTDGKPAVLRRAEMILHIAHHGAYHRGNVGVLMRSMGMELPPDRITNFIDEGPRDDGPPDRTVSRAGEHVSETNRAERACG